MTKSALKITLTRFFAAPRSLVFEAWTTPEHLRRWCAPRGFTIPESRGEFRPGGVWWCCMVAPDGTRHPAGGVYREVVPNECLVFSHHWEDESGQPGRDTWVTVCFADEGQGTRVTLEQGVFDSSGSRDGHLGGWTECLGRLEGVLAENAGRLVIERVFQAPQELVWKAITETEALRQWFFPLDEFRPEVGFEFEFTVEHEGKVYRHLCTVTEVVPGERLSYTWRYDRYEGDSLVTLELTPEGEGTKVVLRHAGLKSFPELPDFARESFHAGWTWLVGSALNEYLSASLCEPFVIEREFAAPRDVVWKAWTDREQFPRWFGPKGCVIFSARMDFRPGGELLYGMRMPDGSEMWGKWIFREIEAPRKIIFTNSFAGSDGTICRPPFPGVWPLQMLTTIVFEARGEKTFLRLQWIPFNASAAERATFDAMRGSFAEGWTGTFEQLEVHLRNPADS
jgi:uncharacterized protein YndB with AHSA1/START domain